MVAAALIKELEEGKVASMEAGPLLLMAAKAEGVGPATSALLLPLRVAWWWLGVEGEQGNFYLHR